jgi:hypothetical protein
LLILLLSSRPRNFYHLFSCPTFLCPIGSSLGAAARSLVLNQGATSTFFIVRIADVVASTGFFERACSPTSRSEVSPSPESCSVWTNTTQSARNPGTQCLQNEGSSVGKRHYGSAEVRPARMFEVSCQYDHWGFFVYGIALNGQQQIS